MFGVAVRHENEFQWLNGARFSIAEGCKPMACVQGCVYTAYGIFVITLIPRFKRIESADNQGGFPDSWATSDIGKFGCALLLLFSTLACACAVIFDLLMLFCWCCLGAVVYVHECNHCKQCVMFQSCCNTPHTYVAYATLQDCYIRLGILDCHHHSAASCVHSQLPL